VAQTVLLHMARALLLLLLQQQQLLDHPAAAWPSSSSSRVIPHKLAAVRLQVETSSSSSS
jgi:hypothetical protein